MFNLGEAGKGCTAHPSARRIGGNQFRVGLLQGEQFLEQTIILLV